MRKAPRDVICLICREGGGTLHNRPVYVHGKKECADALEETLNGLGAYLDSIRDSGGNIFDSMAGSPVSPEADAGGTGKDEPAEEGGGDNDGED